MEVHSQQTIQELKKVLDKCIDTKTKNQILRKITELEQSYGLPIEYLDRGQNSVVFSLKDIVLKFGRSQDIFTPFSLQDIESVPFSKDGNLRIIPRMDTSDITEDDAQYMYNQLRKSGFIWIDAHSKNIGRIPNSGKNKDGLRIIDDEHILPENEIFSAFEILYFNDVAMLKREYYYQKSINPNFKLKDIKKIMKINSNIQIDLNNPLIDKYNLHLRRSELKAPSAVIAHLKCELWNEKHKNDNVAMINMPGFYPKLYKVYDENGELSHVTKHNPLRSKQLKMAFQKMKNLFLQDKPLKLPSKAQPTRSISEGKERFIRKMTVPVQYLEEQPQNQNCADKKEKNYSDSDKIGAR